MPRQHSKKQSCLSHHTPRHPTEFVFPLPAVSLITLSVFPVVAVLSWRPVSFPHSHSNVAVTPGTTTSCHWVVFGLQPVRDAISEERAISPWEGCCGTLRNVRGGAVGREVNSGYLGRWRKQWPLEALPTEEREKACLQICQRLCV